MSIALDLYYTCTTTSFIDSFEQTINSTISGHPKKKKYNELTTKLANLLTRVKYTKIRLSFFLYRMSTLRLPSAAKRLAIPLSWFLCFAWVITHN